MQRATLGRDERSVQALDISLADCAMLPQATQLAFQDDVDVSEGGIALTQSQRRCRRNWLIYSKLCFFALSSLSSPLRLLGFYF